MIHWDNFPVLIKVLCEGLNAALRHGGAPLPIYVFSLQQCAPLGAKQRFTGTISRFRRRYKGPNKGLNASLGHKGAPLPTLRLLFITVPRNGQKRAHLGTTILRKSVLFLTEDGHVLLYK